MGGAAWKKEAEYHRATTNEEACCHCHYFFGRYFRAADGKRHRSMCFRDDLGVVVSAFGTCKHNMSMRRL